MKLSIITTHPIQYNAPWFKLLAREPGIQLKVFYTWSQSQQGSKFDPGFNKSFKWDIPFLEGYEYVFVNNIAKNPGSHHFMGIDNPTLNKEVAAWQPDAVLVIGWAFKSHLAAMRFFKRKIPVFFRGDSTLIDEQPGFSIKKAIRKLWLNGVYKKIDKALYVGENNKLYFKKFGLKEDQLVFAPHAIDNDRFRDADGVQAERAKQWRKEMHIQEDEIVFLFAGKFEAKKNPVSLIKAFIEAVIPKSHLVLVGNGVQENELKRLAHSHTNIHFIDFQNQSVMPAVYRIADIFVLPSVGPGETWGLAINEAMACGCAVIASDKCGGAIDLVDHKGGVIFEAGNITSLKNALLHFSAENKRHIKELGNYNAHKIAGFSFKKIVQAIKEQAPGYNL